MIKINSLGASIDSKRNINFGEVELIKDVLSALKNTRLKLDITLKQLRVGNGVAQTIIVYQAQIYQMNIKNIL